MNDIFSFLPSMFLRIHNINISSTLLDIEHPLGQGDDGAIRAVEVYARYITFSQPYKNGFFPRSKESLNTIEILLKAITQYELNLYYLIESDEREEARCIYQDLDLHLWAMTIVKSIEENPKSNSVLYNKRINPSWYYFRSLDKNVSVVFSPKTAYMLRKFYAEEGGINLYHGENYNFCKSNSTLNSFKDLDKERIESILHGLGENVDKVVYVPIENRLLALAERNIVSLECECDRKVYSQGKEAVISRRKKEQDFLFEGKVYTWADRIDGARFEELSRELLIRTHGVIKVSNTSVTNEPDSNADLICIWDTASLFDMPQDEHYGPIRRRKIVIQCKAWSKNIGKNDIASIRDTLDRFDAGGMLVVTSKSIAKSLFDHFEILRRKGIWVDYWDRSHIEGILDENPDLVGKYNDIVSFG